MEDVQDRLNYELEVFNFLTTATRQELCDHPNIVTEDGEHVEEVWGAPMRLGQVASFCSTCGKDMTADLAEDWEDLLND